MIILYSRNYYQILIKYNNKCSTKQTPNIPFQNSQSSQSMSQFEPYQSEQQKQQQNRQQNAQIQQCESESTSSLEQMQKQTKQQKKKIIAELFRCEIAQLLLNNHFKFKTKKSANHNHKVGSVDVTELAELFKQLIIWKRLQILQDMEEFKIKNFNIDLSKLCKLIDKFLINPKDKNGKKYLIQMDEKVDIIFSSQELSYTMKLQKQIEQIFENRVKGTKGKFWKIPNFTQRSLSEIKKYQQKPTRFLLETNTDPLFLNQPIQQRKFQIQKQIQKLLKMAVFGKIRDDKQYQKKYVSCLKIKSIFYLQWKSNTYPEILPKYTHKGYKPTVLYYVIKNTDEKDFRSIYGEYLELLKPWFIWLNTFFNVICINENQKKWQLTMNNQQKETNIQKFEQVDEMETKDILKKRNEEQNLIKYEQEEQNKEKLDISQNKNNEQETPK